MGDNKPQISCPACRKTNDPAARSCSSCGLDMVDGLDDTLVAGVPPGEEQTQQPAETLIHGDGKTVTDNAIRITDFGEYELLEELARGGMGVVYRARQKRLNRVVAIKMILAGQLASSSDVNRFHIEAEASAHLDHPNIVPIYEVGECDGQHFFSMGFVEGESLDARVEAGGVAPRHAVEIVAKVASAIDYAHSKGVIHRDLKPANILIDHDGEPRITDFGLAKRTNDDSNLTGTGQILGTPSYMPPEQALGKTDEIGQPADVYGLGAVLYSLLTGHPPFRADSVMEVLRLVLEEAPKSPRDSNANLDRDLETICLKCLEKKSSDRYRSAGELAADLERWIQGEPIHARAVGKVERLAKWAARKPAQAALSALVPTAILLASFGGGTAWLWKRAERASEVAVESQKETELALAREQVARGAEATAKEELDHVLYAGQVSLALLKLKDNEITQARQLLSECKPGFRKWEWHYVNNLCHSEDGTIQGQCNGILSVSLSPSGQQLAGTCGDNTLRIWDVQSGEQLHVLEGHNSIPTEVEFSSDGTHLLSCGGDKSAKIWNIESHELPQVLLHPQQVWSASYSPDNQLIVTGGADGIGRIWDVESGSIVKQLTGHKRDIYRACFSPDGSIVATASRDRSVIIWDAGSGNQLRTIPHDFDVTFVVFSPAGNRIATGGRGDTVSIRDLEGNELVTLKGHSGFVLRATFSSDGNRIVTAGADRTARIWDVASGIEQQSFQGHTAGLSGVIFNADSTKVISSSGFEDTIRIWNARDGLALPPLQGHSNQVADIAFNSKGNMLATCDLDGIVNLWDASLGVLLETLPEHKANGTFSVRFSPDDRILAYGGIDGRVRFWDLDKSQKAGSSQTRGAIRGLSFSADGKLLAAGGDDMKVTVWNVDDKKVVLSRKLHSGLGALDFCPQGDRLAVASCHPYDKSIPTKVSIFSVTSGDEIMKVNGIEGAISGIRFSNDGKKLVAGTTSKVIKVWESSTGRELLSLSGHNDAVSDVAFDSAGTRLFSAGWDQTVKVWDAVRGRELLSMPGHHGQVSAVSLSPDGTSVASCSADRSARVWSIRPSVWRRPEDAAESVTRSLDSLRNWKHRQKLLRYLQNRPDVFTLLVELRLDDPETQAELSRQCGRRGDDKGEKKAHEQAVSLFESRLASEPDSKDMAASYADFLARTAAVESG